MNYLITGGTGLIGQALIKSINTDKNTITVLTRNIKSASSVINKKVRFIDKLLLTNIESTDIVINLAGEPIADKRWSQEQKNRICQSRWDITEEIAQLISIAEKPPSLLISGSAIGIYGRQNSQALMKPLEIFIKNLLMKSVQSGKKKRYLLVQQILGLLYYVPG